MRELSAKSQVWGNPFVIYNKEIILTNGSAVFGKIVYQDRDVVKVETLVGRLIIDRNDIVRVVEAWNASGGFAHKNTTACNFCNGRAHQGFVERLLGMLICY